ncbi:MAG: FAD/NAD(P)-binding protein [Desulfobulbaceae bacterium]|nr:FAD/NAD(P)-binding protein [Desulfobulbaceae bacterium]
MMRNYNSRQTAKPGKKPVPLFADRNAYLPLRAIIKDIVEENELVKTFAVVFEDEIYNTNFTYLPGQFLMLSMPHCGEAPISFSSSPSRPGSFSLTIRKAGKLTSAVHELQPGDMIGVRGPYGKPFPFEEMRRHDLLFVAGGIGMAPLRSVIEFCLDYRADYGDIKVLYGCKTPADFCFRQDLEKWAGEGLITTRFTVDAACEEWNGCVGLVTDLLDDVTISAGSVKALVCGPGVMIRFVAERLLRSGLPAGDIITTLERHMKCGIGVCGHCHYDSRMICTDGPVFTVSQLPDLESL